MIRLSTTGEHSYGPLASPLSFDGGLLLRASDGLDASDDRLITVNGTARALWDAVATGFGHEETLDVLARRFAQPKSRIRTDFEPLIDDWLDLGLIEEIDLEPAPTALDTAPPCFDHLYQIGDWPVRIRCHVPHYAEKVQALYAPAKQADATDQDIPGGVWQLDFAEDDRGFFVARNGLVVLRETDQGAARGGLLVQWLQASAFGRPWLACLHASAVTRDGRCLVFSGNCGAGKTTLTLGMLHAGWRLLADDMLPVDGEDLAVWPLPLAMSLKEGTASIGQSMFPEIAELPITETDRGPVRYFYPSEQARRFGEGGLSASALVFPRFESGRDLSLKPIDRTSALQRLTENGSSLDLNACHLHDTLTWLEALSCFELHYGQLDAAIGCLMDLQL